MHMTFVTVEGHQLAADQADRFLADRERVAREMTALLAPRYARVCRATLNPGWRPLTQRVCRYFSTPWTRATWPAPPRRGTGWRNSWRPACDRLPP